MGTAQAFIIEFEMEAKATRNALERIPKDKLDWTPHEKSMSLGKLAYHVASMPNAAADWLSVDNYDDEPHELPANKDGKELARIFDEGSKRVISILQKMSDSDLAKDWSYSYNGQKLVTNPKIAVVRSWFLNHMYHHRGQLSVYLRLLEIPVPATYGNSADENPFT